MRQQTRSQDLELITHRLVSSQEGHELFFIIKFGETLFLFCDCNKMFTVGSGHGKTLELYHHNKEQRVIKKAEHFRGESMTAVIDVMLNR